MGAVVGFDPDERLRTLAYFLRGYWHQNSDLMYDGPRDAALDFANRENEEFARELADNLQAAMLEGTIVDSFDDPIYKSDWWEEFDTLLNTRQAIEVMSVLAELRPTN